MSNLIAVQGYARRPAIALQGYARTGVPIVPVVPAPVRTGRTSGPRLAPPRLVESAGSFAFVVRLEVWGPATTVTAPDPPPIALSARRRRIIICPAAIITPRRAHAGVIIPPAAIITPPIWARSRPAAPPLHVRAPRPHLSATDVRAAVVGPPRTRRQTAVVVDADTYAWLMDA